MVHSSALLLITNFLLIVVTCLENTASLTKVSIYYESLCPDSIDFIRNQFYPNYEHLKDRLLVDFVPYGKASQNRSPTGVWTFRCQHGKDECRGNKYQACVLDQNKGQDKNAKFVNCAMSLPDPSEPEDIKDCVTSNGFDWQTISLCYEENRGSELLAAYGNRTHSLNPKLRFVPTIIFNNIFDQTAQNESINDFLKAACLQLSPPRPDICKNQSL